MAFVDSHGVRIHYEQHAGEVSFLFLHGWGLNVTEWKRECELLEPPGFGTLRVDLRGHGESETPEETGFSMDAFVDDVRAAWKAAGIERPIIVGHSLGGMVALRLLERFQDECRGVVLIDTSYKSALDTVRVIGHLHLSPFVDWVTKQVLPHTHPSRHPHAHDVSQKKLLEEGDFLFGARDLEGVLGSMRTMLEYDESAMLPKIRIPTRIIVGKHDWKTPWGVAHEMAERIPGAELVVVPGIHDTPIESVEAVTQELIRFAGELE